MSDHDLQLELLNQLKDLAVGQAAIRADVATMKDHLAKVNGSVARHEKQLNERQNTCPMVDALGLRVRLLEDFVTASKSADKTSTTWSDHIWPIARWFVGMLLAVLMVLVLAHASIFAPLFKP